MKGAAAEKRMRPESAAAASVLLLLAALHWPLGVLASEAGEAWHEIDCPPIPASDTVRLPVGCEMAITDLEEPFELHLASWIDLQPIIANFATLVSSALPPKTCEERVSLRSAELRVAGDRLVAASRIKFDRWACEKIFGEEVKTRLFEKTLATEVHFRPTHTPTSVALQADVADDGLSDLEREILDLFGVNVKKEIKQGLEKALRLKIADLELPAEIAQALEIRGASIADAPPRVEMGISATVSRAVLEAVLREYLAAGD